jgi:hypothetical protein
MNAQFTRSIAVALALTIGAASGSAAFAAARGNGPSGPSGPGNNGSGGPSHTSNPIPPLADAVKCNADIRCPVLVPEKKPIVKHFNCDYIIRIDGIPYKDCRIN